MNIIQLTCYNCGQPLQIEHNICRVCNTAIDLGQEINRILSDKFSFPNITGFSEQENNMFTENEHSKT